MRLRHAFEYFHFCESPYSACASASIGRWHTGGCLMRMKSRRPGCVGAVNMSCWQLHRVRPSNVCPLSFSEQSQFLWFSYHARHTTPHRSLSLVVACLSCRLFATMQSARGRYGPRANTFLRKRTCLPARDAVEQESLSSRYGMLHKNENERGLYHDKEVWHFEYIAWTNSTCGNLLHHDRQF